MHIDTIFTQVKKCLGNAQAVFQGKRIKMEDADPVQKVLEMEKKDEKIKIIQFKEKERRRSCLF